MKLFWKKQTQAASLENPTVPITAENLMSLVGMLSDAGVHVSPETARRCSAVYACVNLLASTVATIPLKVYKREGAAREEILDDPLTNLIAVKPNPFLTSVDWRDMVMNHCTLQGNHYSYILRNRAYRPLGIYPVLDPAAVTPFRLNGQVYYRNQLAGGGYEDIPAEDILHFKGPGFDGLRAYNPIHAFRNSVGLSLAAEQHGAKIFENGAQLGGLLIKKGQPMKDEARDRFMTSWKENFQGSKNAHKTVLLQEEFEYQQLGIANKDMQFLETRQFQISDIARIFNVPPHMIGDLSRATFNNIEEMSLNFLIYSARPWMVRIESELNSKLFDDGKKYYAEFDVKGLLRGDFQTRMDGYSKAVNSGLMTPNEARALENLPPVDGGEKLRVPVNTMPVDQPPADPARTKINFNEPEPEPKT